MNLRKSLLSTFGVAAVVIGMTGGMVGAVEEAPVNVNFGCESQTGTVDVAVAGAIDVDQFVGNGSLADGVTITLDLTCNWSSNFSVSASIGDFEYQGAPIANPLLDDNFGGEHFRMSNGSIVSFDYPIIPLVTMVPDYQTTVFAGPTTVDNDVIEDFDFIIWWLASPGVTVFNWDAEVWGLPVNLAPGTYTAPLTVDLTVN